MDIGQRIKQIRKQFKISQIELGRRMGVSQAMIAQYENGTRIPKLETIKKIATALNVTMADVLFLDKGRNDLLEKWLIEDPDTEVVTHKNTQISNQPNETNKKTCQIHLSSEYNFEREKKIINNYRKLNEKGQDKAIEHVEMLTKIPEYRKEED